MIHPAVASSESESLTTQSNREFYDALWSGSRVMAPERFNTWPLVKSLLESSPCRLEVAPGLRPRLPIQGTHFIDMSAPAVEKLLARGANVAVGQIGSLPFSDRSFNLVAAFDIIEHVDDDNAALAELSRVAAHQSVLLLSAPLHPERWTSVDDLVGHCRRYEPDVLLGKLSSYGWSVESSAIFGMQPRSSRLLDFAVSQLKHHRMRAIWWYDRVILPLAARFQNKLEFTNDMLPTDDVDEILFVCRRNGAVAGPDSNHCALKS